VFRGGFGEGVIKSRESTSQSTRLSGVNERKLVNHSLKRELEGSPSQAPASRKQKKKAKKPERSAEDKKAFIDASYLRYLRSKVKKKKGGPVTGTLAF